VWEIVTMVPRTTPLFSLASELLPLLEPEISRYDRVSQSEKAVRELKADEIPLRNLVTAVLDQQQGTDRHLLVVDQ
jgi:superfamily II helicase